MKQIYKTIVSGIRRYFQEAKINKAVIGLSGGIDSCVSAKLVCDAIGKENVHGIIMPLKGISDEENIKDTIEYARDYLKITYSVVYINEFVKSFEKLEWEQDRLTKMNTASRIRAVILYNYANSNNALVIGTSNKTEIKIGYFTKYGDGAVDLEVIGSLYKTDEYKLAEFIGIPGKMIEKVPTAELFSGQTDEKEIGAGYPQIDEILKAIEDGIDLDMIKEKHGEKIVLKILKMMENAKHKCVSPKVIL